MTAHILYRAGDCPARKAASPEETPMGDLDECAATVRSASKRLHSMPIDAIIHYFGALAEHWLERQGSGNGIDGLNFLLYWLRPSVLRETMDAALRGNRLVLDGPDSLPGNGRKFIACPRGLVCHWLAGNTPMIGMLSLLQGVLSKNANIVKVARKNWRTVPDLLAEMAAFRSGDDDLDAVGSAIAGSVCAVWCPSSDGASLTRLSRMADMRVAWGGREAVETILSLPRAWHSEDVVFGPRTSFAVVGRERLGPAEAKTIAKRIAADASLFEQEGCNSPHTVFIERGGEVSPGEFAALLATGLEDAFRASPRMVIAELDAVKTEKLRIEYDMRGTAYYPEHMGWTVLYSDEDMGLAEPNFNRTLFVRSVGDIGEVAQLCSHATQSVGLAANARRRDEFVQAAAVRGADRFPEPGRMMEYEVPWDGLFFVDRAVRWVKC